jgi:hypothetical protein
MEHFEQLFTSVKSQVDKDYVLDNINQTIYDDSMITSAFELQNAISKLKLNKACVPDGLISEHFKYSHTKLSVLLSCCFTAMLSHGFIPLFMLDTFIVPIVKNPCGKLTDMKNYRPIALSNIVSKLFERILLTRCEQFLCTADNQFGFKSKHSTDLCVYALHECINFLKSRNTSIFITCLDASQAFDRLNHWKLFANLIERGVPLFIVRIIAFWYRNQEMCIKWGRTVSTKFHVCNGVKQGGILSPRLFTLYMDDLSKALNKCNIGCNYGGKLVNHFGYADDMCLVTMSTAGMQILLNVCDEYSKAHDIKYNPLKSNSIHFLPKSMKGIDIKFTIDNSLIPVTNDCKYLGTTIGTNRPDY